MLNRRNLLGSLGGFPFLGFLKSEDKQKQIIIADSILEDVKVNIAYELQQCFCSCLTCGPNCPNYGKDWDKNPEVEVLMTLNKDGKLYELKILGQDIFWRNLE